MNKTKIILIAIGAVAALGTIVLSILIYNAISAKGKSDEKLEFLDSESVRLARSKVYPGPEAVKATEDNRKAYEGWSELALALASAGDQKFEVQTPASFKAFINEEAKRLSDLPGTIEGRFVKSDFGFGFDEYINKGKLPAVADMPRLQREWNDISVFIAILIDAKASSIVDLQLAKAAPVEAEVEPRRGKAKAKAAKASVTAERDVTRFDIVFNAGHAALVKVLNDIAANPRFMVAEEYSFVRQPDSLAERLGEKAGKKQENARRRRRGESRTEEASAEAADSATGLVTSPETTDDFRVIMKVAVYDFRTKSNVKAEKEGQE